MKILGLLRVEILYRPVFNLLVVFLILFGGNLWIAIILLTLLIRFATIKLTSMGNKTQQGMSDMQPRLHEIQEKYKDNPEQLSKETMKVFKTHGAWPLKWCLMMLIQIPVFIALYQVVIKFSHNTVPTEWLYSFLYNSVGSFFNIQSDILTLDNVNTSFLWIDLLAKNNVVLTAIAAVLTFLQTKVTMLVKPQTPTMPAWKDGQKTPDMWKMMWFMNIFLVIMIWGLVWQMEAAIGLYLCTTTLFSVVQYTIQYRSILYAKWLELTQWKDWMIVEKK